MIVGAALAPSTADGHYIDMRQRTFSPQVDNLETVVAGVDMLNARTRTDCASGYRLVSPAQ